VRIAFGGYITKVLYPDHERGQFDTLYIQYSSMKTRLITTALTLLVLSACNVETITTAKEGPEGSWWLGGLDGGAYIKITEDNNPDDNLYQGVIFFDYDKTVWYRGPFKLIGNLDFSIDDHDPYLAWDGERLYLKQSSYLEAVNPIPKL
jgi:hypothetical protein